jgi:hypothetical protein
MIQPTHAQLNAGIVAGRKALQDYSSFDSSMVTDDALATFVADVALAILNVPAPHPNPIINAAKGK